MKHIKAKQLLLILCLILFMLPCINTYAEWEGEDNNGSSDTGFLDTNATKDLKSWDLYYSMGDPELSITLNGETLSASEVEALGVNVSLTTSWREVYDALYSSPAFRDTVSGDNAGNFTFEVTQPVKIISYDTPVYDENGKRIGFDASSVTVIECENKAEAIEAWNEQVELHRENERGSVYKLGSAESILGTDASGNADNKKKTIPTATPVPPEPTVAPPTPVPTRPTPTPFPTATAFPQFPVYDPPIEPQPTTPPYIKYIHGTESFTSTPSGIQTIMRNTFVNEGHHFLSWLIDGSFYAPTNILAIASVKSAYAQWGVNTCIVTFNYNTDFVFNNANKGTIDYDNSGLGGVHVPTTYNDSTGAPTAYTTTTNKQKPVSCGSAIGAMPYPSIVGYTFLGWSTENIDGNGDPDYIVSSGYPVPSDITLYACWQADTYDITLVYNFDWGYPSTYESTGRLTSLPLKVTYNKTYGATDSLPTPSRTGYTFLGWYAKNKDGNGDTSSEKITDSTRLVRNSDHTLYAAWKVNTYNITYVTGTTEVTVASTTIKYGATYGSKATKTISRSNYKNTNKWSLDINGSTGIVTSSTVFTHTTDVTLYAQWTGKRMTITFDYRENVPADHPAVNLTGNTVTSIYVQYGKPYGFNPDTGLTNPSRFPKPSREGYVFAGWFYEDLVTPVNEADLVLSSETTLYAGWSPISVDVTYDPEYDYIAPDDHIQY